MFAKTNLHLVLADTDAVTGSNSPVALAGGEVSWGYRVSASAGSPQKKDRPSGQIAAQPFFTQLAHGKTLEHLQTRCGLVSRYENCATMTTDRSLSLQSPASKRLLGGDDGDSYRLHSAQERGALRLLDRLTRVLGEDME